jgi:RNA polymerase sigma factor (sigma-70 family)
LNHRMTESFTNFYRESKDPVFRAVLSVTRSIYDAEESTSEAYARAYSRWEDLSEHPNPQAWVVTTALNHQRSTWRKLRRLIPFGTQETAHEDVAEVDDLIVALVMSLAPRQREAIALCVLMDLDSESAGEVLGLAPSTVRVHLHRGLKALKEQLEREDTSNESN